MHFYLTPSKIPELAGLSQAQKRLVVRRCLGRGQFWFQCMTMALVGTVVTILWATVTHGSAASWTALGAGAVVASIVSNILVISRARPEIRRFLVEHAEEIQATE